MKSDFEVKVQIAKPVATVFQALTEPEHLIRYFLASASASLSPGASVVWAWSAHEKQTLEVVAFIPEQCITLSWNHSETGYLTEIHIELTTEDTMTTQVVIRETGWKDDAQSVNYALHHCAGWNTLLLCLKAYLIYDIDLR